MPLETPAGTPPAGGGAPTQTPETPPGGPGDHGDFAFGGPDDGAHADGDDADDDDADDDIDVSQLPYKDDPQFKRMQARLKKLNRQTRRMRPVYGRVKDQNLDELLANARGYTEVQRILASHPDLREQVVDALSGRRKPSRDGGKGGANADSDDAPFDESKLPFRTDDESGRYFANMAKELHETKRLLRQTTQSLQRVQDGQQAQTVGQEMSVWRAQVEAAAKAANLPPLVRKMFNDAVYGAFREAQRGGGRIDPQKVIRHYLGEAAATSKDAKKGAAAAARAAGTNEQLPRAPASPGTPASARKPGETVADVNRRLRGGGGFVPQ